MTDEFMTPFRNADPRPPSFVHMARSVTLNPKTRNPKPEISEAWIRSHGSICRSEEEEEERERERERVALARFPRIYPRFFTVASMR